MKCCQQDFQKLKLSFMFYGNLDWPYEQKTINNWKAQLAKLLGSVDSAGRQTELDFSSCPNWDWLRLQILSGRQKIVYYLWWVNCFVSLSSAWCFWKILSSCLDVYGVFWWQRRFAQRTFRYLHGEQVYGTIHGWQVFVSARSLAGNFFSFFFAWENGK